MAETHTGGVPNFLLGTKVGGAELGQEASCHRVHFVDALQTSIYPRAGAEVPAYWFSWRTWVCQLSANLTQEYAKLAEWRYQ
jgi:hypothetical protein